MAILDQLTRLWSDPPPAYAFEVSEAGVAFAPPDAPSQIKFRPFEPGVLLVSPSHDNVQNAESFAAHIAALAPQNGRKRRTAAVILPDYCARVQVLDFDSFPDDAGEQLSLIRFRLRKSVPFDIESAVVSYSVQPPGANGKLDVIAALVAKEIVTRYEAPFRAAGFAPGFVTTSTMAMLNLAPRSGRSIVLKLSGRVLSLLALDGERLKLARCVELDAVSPEDVLAVLYPTLAFIEDEMSERAERLLMCGFGDQGREWALAWQQELQLPVEALRSRFGAPGSYNAGLLGYLEEVGASA
jgi:type IV pilus assembly protein PilM